jgi:hypothetical protein
MSRQFHIILNLTALIPQGNLNGIIKNWNVPPRAVLLWIEFSPPTFALSLFPLMWRSSHVEYIPLGPIDTTSPQPPYSPTTRPPTSFRRILPTLRLLALPLTLITLYFLLPLLLNRARPTPPPEYLSHAGTSVLETTIVLPKLQYNFANSQGGDDERRQKVKESIKRTWDLYVQQAWGWDEVRPIRGGGRDTR